MQIAEKSPLLRWLPAFRVLACIYFQHFRLVLSEIKLLSRKDFVSHSLLKVCIRNKAIFIPIQFRVESIKLLISDLHAPMIKIKFEFTDFNPSTLFLTKVMERLSDSFPLRPNLFQQLFCHIFILYQVL